jgi:transposase
MSHLQRPQHGDAGGVAPRLVAGIEQLGPSPGRHKVPGIGPITAAAISALAPPAQTFSRGRDFAAWLGLTALLAKGGIYRTSIAAT